MKKIVSVFVMLCAMLFSFAQTPVTISKQTTYVGGKKYYIHIVEKGQTVFSISRAYGTNYHDAVCKNDIDKIAIGDTIFIPVNEVIPTPEFRYYVVKQGNTLYGLSKENNIGVDKIIEMNPNLKYQPLKVGEVIKLPVIKETPKEDIKKQEVTKLKEGEKLQKPIVVDKEPTVVKSDFQQTDPVQKTNTQSVSTTTETKEISTETKPITKQETSTTGRKATAEEPLTTEKKETKTLRTYQKVDKTKPKTETKPKIYPEPLTNLATPKQQETNKQQTTQVVNQPATQTTVNQKSTTVKPKTNSNTKTINVSLLMPLYLDNINEISTSKFDIEQRRKRKYKSFEFIQFYEGILLGLKTLESCGINVNLIVADIPGDYPEKVTKAFTDYNMANSDFIIALLEKKSFETAATLAKTNNIHIINPLSTRSEILDKNPFVIKITPSNEGIIKNMLAMISRNYNKPNIFVIHSKSKLEKTWLEPLQTHLKNQNKIKYTIFDWAANSKLVPMLKNEDDNIVINIYDQDRNKNKVQSNKLLNSLFSIKKNTPTLITTTNWMDKYEDVDYSQLQRLNYHIYTHTYLDYTNPKHKMFIDKFKEEFKTEPLNNYAAIGNDIIIHFVIGLRQHGTAFWTNPNISEQHTMLYHYEFKQANPENGFENQKTNFYKLNSNYKLVPVK